MKTKFYGYDCIIHKDTAAAVLLSFDHPDYGRMTEIWVPKANLHPDSLDVVDEASHDDVEEIFIAAWWIRKNFGEPSRTRR